MTDLVAYILKHTERGECQCRDGLELILIPCIPSIGGWNYDWQDRHGRTICCGHHGDGKKHEARVKALAHLQGALKGATA